MKKGILLLAVGFVTFIGFSQIPNGYYNSAQGLSGEQLREALHQIIKGHSTKSYDNLWNYYSSTDKKSNGKVWDMYSDKPTPAYEFTFSTDQCGNYSAEGDCYNREHSFPKSWFNDASPMNSDLFHVYPTDGWVNNKRGNYPFGEVSSATWTSTNGSKVGNSSVSGYSGTVFEPIDEYKGDFARTYFYMVTRYKDVASGWNTDVLSGNNLSGWAITMFLAWDENDPVSQKEVDRNNAVYGIQNNRNPYIDNPDYVDYVWGGKTPSDTIVNAIKTILNPTKITYINNTLSVKREMNNIEELKIISILGQEIGKYKLLEKNQAIPLNLEKGIYIAIVNGMCKKFAVQ